MCVTFVQQIASVLTIKVILFKSFLWSNSTDLPAVYISIRMFCNILNWVISGHNLKVLQYNQAKALPVILSSVMHKFPETGAMIIEHNEHQLNVNVINVRRRTGSFYKLSRGETMTPSAN